MSSGERPKAHRRATPTVAPTRRRRYRGARIRTEDLGHPKAARYQAAPRPATAILELSGRADAPGRQPLGSAPMADVRPIHATHYDLGVVGSLQKVAAPPYDVIDAGMRAELLERSPYNAVAIDLPKPYGETGPQQTDDDPYERAARTMDEWRQAGALVADSEPAIWAMTQDYTGPDGTAPHPPRHPRPGPRRGLLRRPGPAPRAHPAGPEEGPARPDPRHPPQPLADLLAQHQGPLAAGRAGDRSRRTPGAKRPTKAAPSPRSGGSATRRSSPRSPSCSPARSC